MVTRHEFLEQLHAIVAPTTYLEIGVQHGTSLNLATGAKAAIGIDPFPQTQAHGNQTIFPMFSNTYFAQAPADLRIDLAFIDGSHLFEDALEDFRNVRAYSHSQTVVVFDDMLPYDQAIAGRAETPGHWTGDVWKVYEILSRFCSELEITPIDTSPTGTMVVRNLMQAPPIKQPDYEEIVRYYLRDDTVPQYIINRIPALDPESFLMKLKGSFS